MSVRGRRGRPPLGERVPLGLRVTPETKARLDAAAQASGRSQSQEAELRLENSFRERDLLDKVFAGAVETAFALLEMRGTVKARGKEGKEGETFVFFLDAEAEEAVQRNAQGNIPYARGMHPDVKLKKYGRVGQKNGVTLVTATSAAATAADAVMKIVKDKEKSTTRERLAAEIRDELVARTRPDKGK